MEGKTPIGATELKETDPSFFILFKQIFNLLVCTKVLMENKNSNRRY